MAIFGYSGKPGAGKSYSVVAHAIIPALKAGRTIYHNMVLNEAALRAQAGMGGKLVPFNPECTSAELVAGAPHGALVIIDESARYWGAGLKVSAVPPQEFEFFTKHRHRVGEDGVAMDIVIICQDFGSQCAAFIRELVEYTYYSVKLSALGMSKTYRLECYQGCVKGDSPSQKKLVNKKVSKYRKEIYACYVSHTQSVRGVAGEEIRGEGTTIWRNWKVIASGIAILAVPLFVWWAASSVLAFKDQSIRNSSQHGAGTPAQPEHSEGKAGVPRPSPVVVPPPSIPSSLWRLAGEIIMDGKRIFIVDGERGSRLVSPLDCKRDNAGNLSCIVDGLMVAEWTGPAAPAFNRWFQSSASSEGATP